jgi:hypothetical protein
MNLSKAKIKYLNSFSLKKNRDKESVFIAEGVKLVGDTEEVTALFDVHNYKKENCELVAWVQNQDKNKEVFQAVKISIGTEAADYDLGISNIEQVST